MLGAMVSNRPEQAGKALDAYQDNDDVQPGEWLIVTPHRMHAAMKKASKDVDATIMAEEDASRRLPPALQAPFAPSFGGFRNVALAFSAREKKDLVFLDDDTRPLDDVFRRHQRFLEAKESAGIVIGKYSGHVGGSSSTLLDLTHALEKRNDGRMGAEEFKKIVALRLKGVPPVQKPVEHAGCVGGNLAIGWKTARVQAFNPLPFRVEDGTYAQLCADAVQSPAVAKASVVRHDKTGKPDGLHEELAGDWKGNVLAAYVVAVQKGGKPDFEQLKAQVRKGLLLDYFDEKYAKSRFKDAALDAIYSLHVDVGQKEAEAAASGYASVQAIWPKAWESVG